MGKTFSIEIYFCWCNDNSVFILIFLAMLQSVKSELERQTQLRTEAESKLKESETQLKSIQAKSKQLINGMQSQLEEQAKARVIISFGLTQM